MHGMYVLHMPKKERPPAQARNLGGVRLSEPQWRLVRQRYKAERELGECFSVWVRRKLVAA